MGLIDEIAHADRRRRSCSSRRRARTSRSGSSSASAARSTSATSRPDDVLSLETLRLGLRSDTMERAGDPASPATARPPYNAAAPLPGPPARAAERHAAASRRTSWRARRRAARVGGAVLLAAGPRARDRRDRRRRDRPRADRRRALRRDRQRRLDRPLFDESQRDDPERFAACQRGRPGLRFPGGESFAAQQLRVRGGLVDVRAGPAARRWSSATAARSASRCAAR